MATILGNILDRYMRSPYVPLGIAGILALAAVFLKDASTDSLNVISIASADSSDYCAEIGSDTQSVGENPHPEAFISCAGFLE